MGYLGASHYGTYDTFRRIITYGLTMSQMTLLKQSDQLKKSFDSFSCLVDPFDPFKGVILDVGDYALKGVNMMVSLLGFRHTMSGFINTIYGAVNWRVSQCQPMSSAFCKMIFNHTRCNLVQSNYSLLWLQMLLNQYNGL